MDRDETKELQNCIDRMRSGDGSARDDLVGQAYERLRRLAKTIFHQDFPRLQHLHGTGTILHETALRLLAKLRKVQPATVREFFGLSAECMRKVLLDLARKARRKKRDRAREIPAQEMSSKALEHDPPETTDDPAKLARWTEFHERVAELPAEEREVFNLRYYHAKTNAETAQILKIHEKLASRRWLSAGHKLGDCLP